MEERDGLVQTLLKHFLDDLSQSAKPLTQEQTINFVTVLISYLKESVNDENSGQDYDEAIPFDSDTFIELNLLKPYREKMIPFVKTGLKYYFARDEYNQSILFKKLAINEPLLNEDEYQTFVIRLYQLMQTIKQNIYLRPVETVLPTSDLQPVHETEQYWSTHGFKSRSTEYSRTRQILLYYFVLKVMGITKLDNSSRKLAQFAHVLFAYPIDNIDNSAIYKLLKKAPYLKEDHQAMLNDLEFVKSQFELIGCAEGVALVQKEIDLMR